MLLLNDFVLCTALHNAALHRMAAGFCWLSSSFKPHVVQLDTTSTQRKAPEIT